MHDAPGAVEPAGLVAPRKARVPGGTGEPHRLVDAGSPHQELDLGLRAHGLARPPVPENEHVVRQPLVVKLDQALLRALAQQRAQLVLGMRGMTGLAGPVGSRTA